MNIGKIISFFLTLVVIGVLNFGVTLVSDISFIDSSFFVGLICVFIIFYFSSSGGFSSRYVDFQIQGQTGIKVISSDKKFSPSFAFFASIVYLVGAIIATFIQYKDYLIK
jgi:hypothetical protein